MIEAAIQFSENIILNCSPLNYKNYNYKSIVLSGLDGALGLPGVTDGLKALNKKGLTEAAGSILHTGNDHIDIISKIKIVERINKEIEEQKKVATLMVLNLLQDQTIVKYLKDNIDNGEYDQCYCHFWD